MKTFRNWITFLFIFLSITSLSLAETIVFKSGDQLVGTILTENSETVLIDVHGNLLQARSADILYIVENGMRRNVGESIPGDNQIEGATQTIVPPDIPSGTESISPPTVSSSTPQPLLPVVLPKGKAYQVTGAGIRFREGPSTEYPISDTLSGQAVLVGLEFQSEWLRAKTLDEEEGWIHQNFIRLMDNTPCLVTGDRLNLREAPGEVYQPLERLRKGDMVIKLDENENWFYVLYEERVAGWCSKEYLLPLTNESAYRPTMTTVVNSEVNMPVLIEKNPLSPQQMTVNLTVRDPSIVQAGKTKVIVFHEDRTLLDSGDGPNYVSESIVNRKQLSDSSQIMQAGMPEELAIRFVGGDILTMLGTRVDSGWLYTLKTPRSDSIVFSFIVQEGPARGTIILVE